MRTLVLSISLFCVLSMADEMRFSSSEYQFRPKFPIFVFELGENDRSEKIRVCYAGVQSISRGNIRFGTAIPEDLSDCSSVEAFGGSDLSFVLPAVLEGRGKIQGANRVLDEQVKIRGKLWTMSSDAKVIFRLMHLSADKKDAEYAHICRLELKPFERFEETDAPQKSIFCKAIKPITAQETDLKSRPKFDKNGNPVMFETMVCPRPENCIKPEWAIEPTMRIMPEEFAGTVHAQAQDQAVVHREEPPVAPMTMP